MRVLHIFECFRRGGPSHALIGAALHSGREDGLEHRVLSLLPADPHVSGLAAKAGLTVVTPGGPAIVRSEIADADIVQVHFWNSADLHALMESDLPPMRVLAWCHVNGQAPPQILPRALFAFADIVAATSPASLDLPLFRNADPDSVDLIPAGANFDRLEGVRPSAHDGFAIGYLGRVDFGKMHPDFVALCARIDIPSARFIVCGDGGSRRLVENQVKERGLESRFDFRGHVENILPILSALDVFGYPLCEGNSTTAELAVQEAMFAGVPPVVLKHGGPARLVVNDHSGIVAQNADEYVQAIEFLYRDPAARARMAANAARQAREQFGARLCAERLNAAYRRLSLRPKRKRARSAGMAEVPNFDRGARQLVRSLDGIGDEHFQTSLSAGPAGDIATAEEAIAELPPIFANVVMQYRLRYPDDAFLRLWCGLLFAHADRPALAASEFKASMKLRPDIERVTQYFAAAARKSGAHDHASGSLKAGVSA